MTARAACPSVPGGTRRRPWRSPRRARFEPPSKFRARENKAAVDVRAKLSSLFGDSADFCETQNLKPARVGQHRALPADELVQTAAGSDHLNAGPQPKVIRVAEYYPGVEVVGFKFLEANALHRAGVPTGMKTGVSISPRRVRILARARLALARKHPPPESFFRRFRHDGASSFLSRLEIIMRGFY